MCESHAPQAVLELCCGWSPRACRDTAIASDGAMPPASALGLRLPRERRSELPKGGLEAGDLLPRARQPECPRSQFGGDVVLQVDSVFSAWAGVHHLQAERLTELKVNAPKGADSHLCRMRMHAVSPSAQRRRERLGHSPPPYLRRTSEEHAPILRANFPASEEHTPRSLARTHARPGSTPRKARRSHADGRAAALTRRHDAEAEHEAG